MSRCCRPSTFAIAAAATTRCVFQAEQPARTPAWPGTRQGYADHANVDFIDMRGTVADVVARPIRSVVERESSMMWSSIGSWSRQRHARSNGHVVAASMGQLRADLEALAQRKAIADDRAAARRRRYAQHRIARPCRTAPRVARAHGAELVAASSTVSPQRDLDPGRQRMTRSPNRNGTKATPSVQQQLAAASSAALAGGRSH